ncbi:MAG: circularly permuted type 2 ATP-grasp protein, partial [Gorillibacterium sp.]|nr:circularly permuted type 2 ATP-grasp protein [Gorillibacterium sp.]
VPGDVYVTTAGIDIIRDERGRFMVLEDNLRTPSGFSYLYKSRMLMDQLFPEQLDACLVRDVEQSLNRFLRALRSIAPSGGRTPVIALLSPGSYNSAYYEHTYLAQQMGIYLVEGRDLTVKDHKVYMRGIHGLRQVDVIYRRIDDEFLDPLAFNPQSMLGVPGLMNAYRAGNVAIANAPGTGVSDDKAVYAYVPDMIRYYLNEEPLLDNVETYLLTRAEERDYVLANLEKLVIKETSLSGGYGMLIGPSSTLEQRQRFAAAIIAEPERYIAQPTVQLSRSPILLNGAFVPRHVDLRAFVLTGEQETHVIPGGLSRVAMTEGSLVVNSSQGGGCKDTWVLSR